MNKVMLGLVRSCAAFVLASTLSTQVLLAASSSEAKQYWPQWRGPLNTGEAPQGNPPTEWSEEKNVKWKIKLPGHGASTPIIWKNMVLIQAAVPTGKKIEAPAAAPGQGQAPPTEQGQGGRRRGGGGGFGRGEKPTEFHQFYVIAYDRTNGKELWKTMVKEEVPHEGHHQDHGYSSYSPVTDGEHIIALFGSRGLYGMDMHGKILWSKELGRMNVKNGFGEGSSPALHGNTVVINWDHEGEDFIAAFHKKTGKELWRQKREEDTTWATPLIVEHEGKGQVVTPGTKKVRTYDLQTGELIWESPGLTANAIPTPVAENGVVFVTSGFRGAALYAIKLGAAKGQVAAGSEAVLWSQMKNTPYVPSPLLMNGKLFMYSGNNGILSVFDSKTGSILLDAERITDLQNVYASPVAAKDRIYLVSRGGTAVVAKFTDKLEVLMTNKLDDGFDSSPAIVGNELFLRGRQHLYCLAEK